MKMKSAKKINMEIERDLVRIRRRWAEYKNAVPDASAFLFMAHIVRTGKIPAVPRRPKSARTA
jgi:hypothetical protein